jgi:hypothetical protein
LIRKMIFVFILMLTAIVIIEGMKIVFNPLMRSDEEIRKQMLSQLPLGTHMNEVVHFSRNKKGWSDLKIDDLNGFYKDIVLGEIVGEKHISVYIGEYRKITEYYFITDVQVFFGFNENSELIDIRVRKMTDSL